MAGPFSEIQTPQWMSPLQMIFSSQEQGRKDAEPFEKAYLQARSEGAAQQRQTQQQQSEMDRQRQQQEFEVRQAQTNQQRIASKLAPIADAFRGVDSPESAWNVVSQNPQWLVDQDTGKFVSGFLNSQANVAKADALTTQGKIAIRSSDSFNKRLDEASKVFPEDAGLIGGMSRNKDGTPSKMQIESLSLLEERAQLKKQKIADDAAYQARIRGDQQRTTITAKGDVTQTFTPSKDASQVIPQEMTFGGVPYIVNPRTGNFVRRDKPDQEVSVAKLMSEYNTLNKDATQHQPEINAIRAYVQKRFPSQASLFGVTNAPSSKVSSEQTTNTFSPNKVRTYDPTTDTFK